MRQRRWLELLKNYDLSVLYHPDKANVVVNALSKKTVQSLSMMLTGHATLLEEIRRLSLEVVSPGASA